MKKVFMFSCLLIIGLSHSQYSNYYNINLNVNEIDQIKKHFNSQFDFDDFSEALPCYICILAMPFFYSISEGISMGVISYVILNLMTGKAKEKKISALMYVLTVLFILKYVFL